MGSTERNGLANDRWCFVCGPDNPAGLQIPWTLEDGVARGRFRPGRQHQGWRGIVHGGILAALLDEAMAQRVRMEGVHAVTASLQIRYRKPAPIETWLMTEGHLDAVRSRALQVRAAVLGEDGTCYAEAEGTCVRLKRE